MFLRIKCVQNKPYLFLVENTRCDGKTRQRTLFSFGNLTKLVASGQLDQITASFCRFSDKLAVLGAAENLDTRTGPAMAIGPALIFERLWQETGIGAVLRELIATRHFDFPVERAMFLTVLHRLFNPGSDRAAETWKDDLRIDGVETLALHHLYRAMAWLGEALPAIEQSGATPGATRCTKDLVEEKLFTRRRDPGSESGVSSLAVVFFDTTTIYFEGEGGASLGRRGHSKDHRPDLKQMVVGAVLDDDGNPVCSELWPGNTADVKTLMPVVERLREKFGAQKLCVVADRGMISWATVSGLEERGLAYVLGARMRGVTEIRDAVLSQEGDYEEVYPKSGGRDAPAPLKVKEVRISGRRYIVCLNEDQAVKDRCDREAIVLALQEALARGDKSLVGNKGYRRYLKTTGRRFIINEDKIAAEARYDGLWVLTTNTALSASEAALKYKELWEVEALFRSLKSVLRTRPVYHRSDAAIRGHVFCSFLALVLRKELERRQSQKGTRCEWSEIKRALANHVEIELEVEGKRFVVRSRASGTAAKIYHACRVRIPTQVEAN